MRPHDPLAQLTPADKPMLPLWLKFPNIPAYSIGWRMGAGEDYRYAWAEWYDALADEERRRYQERYPAPEEWEGFYDPDEEED